MKLTNKLIDNYMKQKLGTDPIWAKRAMMLIYSTNQTDSERVIGNTVIDNGIGFSGADAEILSSFAKQYQRWGRLTPKQMAIVLKKAPKYRKQIFKLTTLDRLFPFMIKDGICTQADVEAYKESLAEKAFLKAL